MGMWGPASGRVHLSSVPFYGFSAVLAGLTVRKCMITSART